MSKYPIALHFVKLTVQNQMIPAEWYNMKHNVKSLCIRGGNIATIQENAFNTKAFKRLYYLEFDRVAITQFKSEMFNGLDSLRLLVLRHLHFYKFQSNSLIPTKNPTSKHFHQFVDLHQQKARYKYSVKNVLNLNCTSCLNFHRTSNCIEIFYLNDDETPISPWIALRQMNLILITLIASFFSFFTSIKLSFTILYVVRKIQQKFNNFINNLENEAVAMFIEYDDTTYTIKKLRKVRFSD